MRRRKPPSRSENYRDQGTDDCDRGDVKHLGESGT